MKFSIRQLMICVTLFAVVIAIATYFYAWSQRVIDQKYASFRTLEEIRLLQDGDDLAAVEETFSGLFVVEGAFKETVLAGNPDALPDDSLYAVPVNDGHARFLYFRDKKLINHQFDKTEFEDTVSLLKLSTPPWYLEFGHWLIVLGAFVLFVLTVLISLLLTRKPSGMDPAEQASSD